MPTETQKNRALQRKDVWATKTDSVRAGAASKSAARGAGVDLLTPEQTERESLLAKRTELVEQLRCIEGHLGQVKPQSFQDRARREKLIERKNRVLRDMEDVKAKLGGIVGNVNYSEALIEILREVKALHTEVARLHRRMDTITAP